jgi:hypothetical protein
MVDGASPHVTKRVALIVVFVAGCLDPVVELLPDGGVSVDAGEAVALLHHQPSR